jgi:hypothetical protein
VYNDSVTIFNLTTKTEESTMTITFKVMRTVAFIILSAFLCAPKAHAVVGNVVVSTCDEAHFLAALQGGGFDGVSVTFSCAGVITLTHAVRIYRYTAIDGGGMVTLDGGGIVVSFGPGGGLYADCNDIICGGLDVSNITMQKFPDFALNNLSTRAFRVSNTTFVSNRAAYPGGMGGAINNGGSGGLYVHNCYFLLNYADAGGGAIYNHRQGSLIVGESTFFLNSIGTGGLGGAIFSEGASMYISNSTFTDNGSFTGSGGGNIYFLGDSGTGVSEIRNSTLSGGRSGPGHTGNLGVGPTSQESLPLIVTNTIMANPNAAYNCGGQIISGGGNLQWPPSSSPCVGTFADPKLGLLQNNGGTTLTMALMPGSAAIDKGSDTQCTATDQRHVLRPQGPHCDIGAYEAIPNVIGAVELLESLVQVFWSRLPKTPGGRLIQQVIDPLSSSLDPTLWQADGNHLNPRTGSQVFKLQETVVNNLSDLIIDQIQLDYILNLVLADRTLATVAMGDGGCSPVAPAAGPAGNGCGPAAAELAKGDADAAAGSYGTAMDHYLNAWQDVTQK